MTAFYWAKAHPGAYYIRTTPGGRGAAVGRVWRVDKGPATGTFYSGEFTLGSHAISFHDRHQPVTAIARLEGMILALIPAATFTKEF